MVKLWQLYIIGLQCQEVRPLDGNLFAIISIITTINFSAKLLKINDLLIVLLPKVTSLKLQSRGMVMVEGTINGKPFKTPLEPDGKGSHWFKVSEALSKKVKTKVGDVIKLAIEPVKDWPEPNIPTDLKVALKNNSKAYETWMGITPIARWDWIRWINATKNLETRKIRIDKTFSKFNSGIRRPCCFNRSMCTDPEVSNNGLLLDVVVV